MATPSLYHWIPSATCTTSTALSPLPIQNPVCPPVEFYYPPGMLLPQLYLFVGSPLLRADKTYCVVTSGAASGLMNWHLTSLWPGSIHIVHLNQAASQWGPGYDYRKQYPCPHWPKTTGRSWYQHTKYQYSHSRYKGVTITATVMLLAGGGVKLSICQSPVTG